MPPPVVVPLEPGTILASASRELQRQVEALVPKGKTGATVLVLDTKGIRGGIAVAHGEHFVFMAEAGYDFREGFEGGLKLKASW